ncbi:hypothetical protein L1049_022279 [Liquidambar formosana]|uniref:Uncharacterized protein n=1 Tax=Liquidambar formosana TaxID=63359 RepID=A0AAP0WPZ9_LIQFO
MGVAENMHQLARYGGSNEGKLEGLPLENGDCSSPVVLSKYKRRKVSAVRDFPPGCGPLALCINTIPIEPTGSVGAGRDPVGGDIVGPILENDSNHPRKDSGADVEFHSPEMLQSPVWTELLQSSNDLESNVENLAVLSNKVDGHEVLNVEPMGIELPMASDNAGLIDCVKVLEHEICELSKDSHKVEIAPPDEYMAKSSCLKFLLPPNSPITNGNVSGKTVTRNYPSRRRISATRDFPPFCGKDAPRLSKDDCLKSPSSFKSNSSCQEKSCVEGKLLKETVSTNAKKLGYDVQDEDNIENKINVVVSKNSGDKVYAESEGNGTKEVSKQVKSGTFSEIRVDWEDKREKIRRPSRESDLNYPDHNSQIDSKEGEMDVGGLEGKLGKNIVVCDEEVGCLQGKVGKEIVVYNGEVGGWKGKVGKEIVVYDGELEGSEVKEGKDTIVDDREVGGFEGKLEREIVVHTED